MLPDEATSSVLATAGIGLTVGANLFRGPVRPQSATIPHKAVFCLTTGGPAPLTHDIKNGGPDIKRGAVQVRVRSDVGKFEAGQLLATNAWNALQRAEAPGYMSITCRESAPVYLGLDDTEHHEWTINAETMREE